MLQKLLTKKGFTLVELMVVVAIIGVLSAVAVPNFKKYQAKSKASEAKLQLTALYTAETSIQGEVGLYATCLSNAGYDPSGEIANRYYIVGFAASVGTTHTSASSAGQLNCTATAGASFSFPAGKTINNLACSNTTQAGCGLGGAGLNESSFTAEADGYITQVSAAGATLTDKWTINNAKQLLNIQQGY